MLQGMGAAGQSGNFPGRVGEWTRRGRPGRREQLRPTVGQFTASPLSLPGHPQPQPREKALNGFGRHRQEEGIITWEFGDLGPRAGSAAALGRSPSLSEPPFLQEFA